MFSYPTLCTCTTLEIQLLLLPQVYIHFQRQL